MRRVMMLILAIWSVMVSAQDNSFTRQQVDPGLYPFFHGVASGDPLADKVIIWTKVSPVSNTENIDVAWRMALDPEMTQIVKQGNYSATASRDFTVKVDVTGLSSNKYYYYDFKAFGKHSVRGRTKTAPSADESNEVRLGVVSCSNYEYGYFNTYKMLAKRNDIDAILHLGDYIYEYEVGGYSAGIAGRTHEPENEIVSLQDYRIRHSHYKLDNNLQNLHQQFPFITVWDDHESADNSYKDGANNHTEGAEGSWVERKSHSIQAYMEWMPIRENANGKSIYRTINYGNLVNLYMLDTRIEERDLQAATGNVIEINDSTRRLIGDKQFNWLVNEMKNSTAKWNVVGQQVMMAPLRAGVVPINTDQWDGYEFERSRLYKAVKDNEIKNFVVLTGDIHTSWANDLPENLIYEPLTGTGSLGVEFVVSSVTSPGLNIPMGQYAIQAANLHVQYLDLSQHGYLVLDLNKDFIQGEWYYQVVDTTTDTETFGAAYRADNGKAHLVKQTTPIVPNKPAPAQAPAKPVDYHTGIAVNQDLLVFGVYPNPFMDELQIQFNSEKGEAAIIRMIDIQGKEVISKEFSGFQKGVNYLKVSTHSLQAGTYTLFIQQNGKIVAKNVITK